MTKQGGTVYVFDDDHSARSTGRVQLGGNSATQGAVASLTYAVEALGTELIVVLGHTGCGAVHDLVSGELHPVEDGTGKSP